MVAFYCLMSTFKGVCHLPGNNGFSSLVTCELGPCCADSANKRTDPGGAAGEEPAPLSTGCTVIISLQWWWAGAFVGVPGSPGW